ncbi:MAG: methionine ABC transporter ATP-binding protein [Candidatus Adiutrix sp.]|jgi:D-methionine transport system ATP-binding protein|nr:methionine ABC transporter ATP-binding protein [Candidatus Adiutrix sp.]
MALIEARQLVKTFGDGQRSVEALRGVDLAVEEGEIFGVIGLSGAGKSTLIRCLNRLERPTSGQVMIEGRDLTAMSESELRQSRRRMGMIFQHFDLLSSRTAAGNVSFPLETAGQPQKLIKPRVDELLELVGLTDKAGAYPSQLSGGQKQRVGIARALAVRPRILLCDEATSALDPRTTKSILALIEDVKNRLGLTVVLITHQMAVIAQICDRVAVMDNGRIVESGPVIEVFTRPGHPTSQSFVDEVINQTDSAAGLGCQPKGDLVRLLYTGRLAREPLLSTLGQRFQVEAAILQGRVDQIKGAPFGTLLLDLAGPEEGRRQALAYLKSLELTVKVLNHDADA